MQEKSVIFCDPETQFGQKNGRSWALQALFLVSDYYSFLIKGDRQ
jgi:hypothetical protein